MHQLPASPDNLPAAFSQQARIPAGWQRQDRDPDPPTPFAEQQFRMIRRHWWKMLAFIVVSVVSVYAVSSRMTPIYESTATIDIDRRMPMGILGQEASQYQAGDSDQFFATQVSLIQSDAVLRPVVERFHLAAVVPASKNGPAITPEAARNAAVELKGLSVKRQPNTFLLRISYRSPDPGPAA